MIISVDEVKSHSEFENMSDTEVKRKLDSLESLIRSYTNNNFQNRNVRFIASTDGNKIFGSHPFLRVGDTIQISESVANNGLYVITDKSDEIEVDDELFDVYHNLITKVEYPVDVQEGILNLMLWEMENRKKVGIKTETISRHSVTYYDQDSSNQIMGYPVSLMGFLEPYMKARC